MRAMNIRAAALAVAFLMSLPLLGGCNTILLTRELGRQDGGREYSADRRDPRRAV